MANKKYKLDGNDYWEASGVYDIGQGDTQRNINDEVATKLATIAEGAEVNQNAFSNVTVGGTTIAADSKTDTLTLTAGSNITLTPNATNDSVTISATDTTYDNATRSAAGLMSAADKTKLDTLDSADITDNSTVGGSTVEASLTSLKGSLTSEQTARQNADTALQNSLNFQKTVSFTTSNANLALSTPLTDTRFTANHRLIGYQFFTDSALTSPTGDILADITTETSTGQCSVTFGSVYNAGTVVLEFGLMS